MVLIGKKRKGRKKKNVNKFDFSLSLFCLGLLIWSLYFFSSAVTFFKIYESYRNPQPIRFVEKIRNPQQLNIPILLYHYVEYVKDPNDTIRKSLNILPVVFDNQVATLKSAGYTFITPSDVNNILANKMLLPKKPIILSFDDGYEDFYTDVLPILKKYNVRAVEYVISGFVDEPNYMTTEELNKVIASHLVEIGCHTVHHLDLKHADKALAAYEIDICHKEMLANFHINTVSFAYPYGAYDSSLFPLVKAAGFKNATTTVSGSQESNNNIYEIPRIRPGARMGEELTSYLETDFRTARVIPSPDRQP